MKKRFGCQNDGPMGEKAQLRQTHRTVTFRCILSLPVTCRTGESERHTLQPRISFSRLSAGVDVSLSRLRYSLLITCDPQQSQPASLFSLHSGSGFTTCVTRSVP